MISSKNNLPVQKKMTYRWDMICIKTGVFDQNTQKTDLKIFILLLLFFIIPTCHIQGQNFDLDLLKKINTNHPSDDYFWMAISNTAIWSAPSYIVSNLNYGLLVNDQNALNYGLESTLSMGISLALTSVVKVLVDRPRPPQAYPNLFYSNSFTNGLSFPSAHTSTAFAVATTMAYRSNRLYISIPIFTWPIGVGYSRMRLGKHYPSDVFVGALIGVGSGVLSHWIAREIIY